MKIDKIITLTNSKTRLRFLAMERSLREAGCKLPLWVIPYDDQKFDLPPNTSWWEVPEITEWLKKNNAHPTMRKYQCLTVGNYQFVDSDVIFLINPETTLENIDGFVTSCGHWNNPGHTFTEESLKFLKEKSTLWQKLIFNTGQFACDRSLYSIDMLKEKTEMDEFYYTCLSFPYHEQPGINLLVNASHVPVNNLTLPPYNMESTWAGDYHGFDYDRQWTGLKKPYLIHWAGCLMNIGRPIDELFLNYLTQEEKEEWGRDLYLKMQKDQAAGKRVNRFFKKLKRIYHIIKE